MIPERFTETYDPPDDDRLADARRDQWDDDHPPDMVCGECGHEWNGGWIPASRTQPAEPRFPDCPNCGA